MADSNRNPRLHDDMCPVFPNNDIVCSTCLYKKPGIIGFKSAYCEKYTRGKPLGILFKNEPCNFYEREEGGVNNG